MFYTYAYLDEKKSPYYVGKGKGKRAWSYHKGVTVPEASQILILKRNLTEEEAFRHEEYLIFVIGRLDLGTGPLQNKTSGKQGGSGKIISQKTKDKMSASKKGKVLSDPHKEKLSEAKRGDKNPWFGKKGNRAGQTLSITAREKLSVITRGRFKGTKYWVNPCGEVRRSVESPGPEWQNGRVYKEPKT